MRQRKRTHQRPAQNNGWAWLLFGVVLGGVLGSVGYIKWYESRPHVLPPAIAEKKKEIIPKPTYDFYTLLPEVKVEPPRSPASEPIAPKAVAEANTPASPSHYRLQLASFKSFHEADAMKARMALSGLTVEIQSVTLDNGTTWYRVQTPTLASQQEALKLQSSLKAESIQSVVVAAK
jgi:cell division protein FtsN